jgi:hypothetical protein
MLASVKRIGLNGAQLLPTTTLHVAVEKNALCCDSPSWHERVAACTTNSVSFLLQIPIWPYPDDRPGDVYELCNLLAAIKSAYPVILFIAAAWV